MSFCSAEEEQEDKSMTSVANLPLSSPGTPVATPVEAQSPPSEMSEKEKRQKRLLKVRQLMEQRKKEKLLADGVVTESAPPALSKLPSSKEPLKEDDQASSTTKALIQPFLLPKVQKTESQPSVRTSSFNTIGTQSPSRRLPLDATPSIDVAFLQGSATSAEEYMSYALPDNDADTLEEYMVGVDSEMQELQFAPKKVKRKRKRIVKDEPLAPVSITLEEILYLHAQAGPLSHPLLSDSDAAHPPQPTSDSATIDESETKESDNEVAILEPSIELGSLNGALSGIATDKKGESEESGSFSVQGLPNIVESEGAESLKGPIHKVDEITKLEVEDEDRYYRDFVSEVKRQQAERARIEAAKRKKAEDAAAARAAARAAKLAAQATTEGGPSMALVAVPTNEVLEEADDSDYRYNLADDGYQSYFDMLQKVGNKKELPAVDHSTVEYLPFRKNLYIQVREISLMKEHEVDAFRKLNGGIKVSGKMCPRPIKTFHQCGLPDPILNLIERREYEQPFPIQMQCLPALMTGRDVIGIAETGSGKTLAYLLPLIRNMMDQPPLRAGDGPMGLVLAPTRELAVQIQREANRFTRMISVYGGTGIGEQLSALKRGAEMIVATPGRLIDVLTINSGKITNLKRVTFVILDEADRMFDMGFEPQITAILKNVRPDSQTALFSATFPPHIEALAKKILKKPLEIVVGERGKTASRIEQFIEVWPSSREKFLRLLQLLGEWGEHGSIIVFVTRQTEADELFAGLLKSGYASLVLHGGQDQTDRDFTIQDFKDGTATILIATSVASRGLDVKSVVLVINYSAPDHLEDYVHRIGRTGRAGNIGVAYTFLTPDDSDRAEDLIKALEQGGKDVPESLRTLADAFKVQCNMGLTKKWSKGFGGKGFKFTPGEHSKQQQERMRAKKELGLEEDEDDEPEVLLDDIENPMSPIADPSSQLLLNGLLPAGMLGPDDVHTASARAKALAEYIAKSGATLIPPPGSIPSQGVMQKALAIASGASTGPAAGSQANVTYIDPATGNTIEEFDINDYPQTARFKATHKDVLHRIADQCGAVLQVKGRYVAPEERDSPLMIGVKRLYVEIIGSTPIVIQRAKHELRSLLEAVSMKQLNVRPTGKYQVV